MRTLKIWQVTEKDERRFHDDEARRLYFYAFKREADNHRFRYMTMQGKDVSSCEISGFHVGPTHAGICKALNSVISLTGFNEE